MSVTVTLHVFSGRSNPTWILEERQARELLERVHALRDRTPLKAGGILAGLGYRGFTVSALSSSLFGDLRMAVRGGIVDPGPMDLSFFDADRDLERWLLESAKVDLGSSVRKHVEQALETEAEEAVRSFEARLVAPAQSCPPCEAADAPAYNPGAWNIPSVQPYNNCYNYANNQITNTFAQPGRAHGAIYSQLTCGGPGGVQPAAEADGLVPSSNFATPLLSGQGWYVALVIWPQEDFHWYRQDSVGCWSHKPGSTEVRNVDNSGNPIIDPQFCDRGPYTDFCSYMITKQGVVIQ